MVSGLWLYNKYSCRQHSICHDHNNIVGFKKPRTKKGKKITNILKPVMEKYMCKYNTSQIHYYKVLVFVISKSMTMAKTLAPN